MDDAATPVPNAALAGAPIAPVPSQGSQPGRHMDDKHERFFPSGAIAFFAGFLLLYGLIWQGMYLLTVLRR
jgi:hypothetical protein